MDCFQFRLCIWMAPPIVLPTHSLALLFRLNMQWTHIGIHREAKKTRSTLALWLKCKHYNWYRSQFQWQKRSPIPGYRSITPSPHPPPMKFNENYPEALWVFCFQEYPTHNMKIGHSTLDFRLPRIRPHHWYQDQIIVNTRNVFRIWGCQEYPHPLPPPHSQQMKIVRYFGLINV